MRVKSILVGCCSLFAVGVLSACSGTSSHTTAPAADTTPPAATSPAASTTPPSSTTVPAVTAPSGTTPPASTTVPAVTAPSGTTPPASTTVPAPHPAGASVTAGTAAPSAGVPACTSATTRLTAEPQQPANRNGATFLHFTKWAIHFTAISALSQSRRSAARQGRSWGGWARLLGRDRRPARPGGLIAFGRGLATSCR